jgi:hypothetical protein
LPTQDSFGEALRIARSFAGQAKAQYGVLIETKKRDFQAENSDYRSVL